MERVTIFSGDGAILLYIGNICIVFVLLCVRRREMILISRWIVGRIDIQLSL